MSATNAATDNVTTVNPPSPGVAREPLRAAPAAKPGGEPGEDAAHSGSFR
jgi:hypothetical protein